MEYRAEKCIFLFNIHKVLNVFEHKICMYLTKIQEFKGMIGERSESGVKGRMRERMEEEERRKKEAKKKKFSSEYIEKPRFRKCRIYALFLSFNHAPVPEGGAEIRVS